MKKMAVFLMVFAIMAAIMATVVFGASVSRSIPLRVSPGEEIDVKLNINSISVSEKVKSFAIEESLPDGFKLSEWSISGIAEAKDKVKTKFTGNDHKFEFIPEGGSVVISYKTKAPSELGSYTFKATWFDLSGMSGAEDGKSTVTVRVITCGDNVCEGNENSDNCERDCPKPVPSAPIAEPKGLSKAAIGWIIAAVIVIAGLIIYFASAKKKRGE